MTGLVQLSISGQPVNLEITVPEEPTAFTNLLPIFQGLADVVVDRAVEQVEQQGQAISCTKGCGACCRQLVPISMMEAYWLAELVEAMPEPRQTHVRERFAQARQRQQEAGLSTALNQPQLLDAAQRKSLGLAYFQLGIACPFLEEESCSIHPDRPAVCREYLVTSPAADCAQPRSETIKMVPLFATVSRAVRSLEQDALGSPVQWMPLTEALAWVSDHPLQPSPQPGPAMLQAFFTKWLG